MTKSSLRLGIDLGGTKTEIIALEGSQTLLRERVPTPAHSYDEIVRDIAKLVESVETRFGIGKRASVGIGIPGAVSPKTGLVKNANTVCLIGRPFQADLERALGRPVRLANDANCFALSEASDGAAAGSDVVFGVIIGSGTGGGLVVGGRVLVGPNAIAGEWGHNPLPWPRDEERPGPACYCGKTGCIETFLSGPGLRLLHRERTGRDWLPAQIAEAAASGDAQAEAELQLYEDRMARALAHVINIVDPDAIVLGGGLSNLTRLTERVPRLWGQYVFSDHVDTRLLTARHGDSSGVRGAAWLWPET